MPKKTPDLAALRESIVVTYTKGIRSLTLTEMAKRLGLTKGGVSRIESGERWPRERVWARVMTLTRPDGVYLLSEREYVAIRKAQLRTWRAYSPDRKGMTP